MIIFKTVISVLQVLLMIAIGLSCRNKNDRGVCICVELYMFIVLVALWI